VRSGFAGSGLCGRGGIDHEARLDESCGDGPGSSVVHSRAGGDRRGIARADRNDLAIAHDDRAVGQFSMRRDERRCVRYRIPADVGRAHAVVGWKLCGRLHRADGRRCERAAQIHLSHGNESVWTAFDRVDACRQSAISRSAAFKARGVHQAFSRWQRSTAQVCRTFPRRSVSSFEQYGLRGHRAAT